MIQLESRVWLAAWQHPAGSAFRRFVAREGWSGQESPPVIGEFFPFFSLKRLCCLQDCPHRIEPAPEVERAGGHFVEMSCLLALGWSSGAQLIDVTGADPAKELLQVVSARDEVLAQPGH